MKSRLKSIKQAGLAKRLLAILLDGLIYFFFVALIAYCVTLPIANKAFNYTELSDKGTYYKVFSNLYVVEEGDGGEVVPVNKIDKIDGSKEVDVVPLYELKDKDVDFYKARIKYYYLNFKANKNLDLPETYIYDIMEECTYSPLYNKEIEMEDGSKALPENYYTETWFEEKFGSLTTVEEWRVAANEASKDLFESSYFAEINRKIGNVELYFVRLIPLVLCYGVFYVLVPLLFKNGETFAKKFLGIGFTNKDGYFVKKKQIVFRQLLLFVWVGLSMFFYSVELVMSLATLGLGSAIYIIATAIPKTNRSPIDFAAYTYLIDTKKSVWFESPEIEQQNEEKLDEKMSKYRKYEPDQKHLIQVGTEIVDEQVKKEFEEEKSKKLEK